ncbi:hypothetical protein, partial [uncultured Paraglaciecola sp.]|uniref:hypothetical protein n=1 Tax=uncultured Paraglaciecola sp. TaxID=1765024 RepID=UPI002610529D
DYHLNQDEIGPEIVTNLQVHWHQQVPTIVNSADHSEAVRNNSVEAGFSFIPKPVKYGALKQLIRRSLF